jgi:hypothetical protein
MRYTTANKQWRKPRRKNAPRMIAQIFQWSAIMHMLPWAMKGFLVWHDQPFPRTHDLGKLGKQAVELDPTLAPLIDEVAEFTKYAWMFRYPRRAQRQGGIRRRAMLTSHLWRMRLLRWTGRGRSLGRCWAGYPRKPVSRPPETPKTLPPPQTPKLPFFLTVV